MSTEPLQTLVDDYLSACQARGLSPKTINDVYGHTLEKVWLPWAKQAGVRTLDDLDNRVMNRFAVHLQTVPSRRGKPLSEATIHTYLECVRFWLRWCKEEGLVDRTPNVPRQQRPRRILDVLTRDEIEKMEDAAQTERDKVIIRALADTGLRLGELLALTPTDLIRHGREHYLRIVGRSQGGAAKGNLGRLVPVRADLFRRLERLGRAPAAVRTDHVFVGRRRRNGGDIEVVTASGIEQMIRSTAVQAGIERRVYPHLLRHSFATWALNQGMNPVTLARQLGHTSLAMIERVYSHQTASDVHEAMEALFRTEK